MFNFDRFVQDCKSAVGETGAQMAVKALVEQAVSTPRELVAAIGEPERVGINRIYVAENLTILNVVWGPGLHLYPHNHEMWAVIGLYGGREENTFWRRSEQGLERRGTATLDPREVIALGKDAIHSVKNPLGQLTGALHIYGGDFFSTPRSEWDPQTLEEQEYSVARALRLFEESNKRWEEMRHPATD